MITANLWFGMPHEAYRLQVLNPALAKRLLPVIVEVDSGPPLEAFVNHGRWLVKCECGGAEYAWEEGLFMCQSCWNAGHKHLYRRSVFPAERAAIEKLLLVRPLDNRNWWPHETVADLERENEIHKAELL